MFANSVRVGMGEFLKKALLAVTCLNLVIFPALVFIMGAVFGTNHLLNLWCFIDFFTNFVTIFSRTCLSVFKLPSLITSWNVVYSWPQIILSAVFKIIICLY